MSVIYIVLPLAVLLAIGAVALFVWATRDGQFDDLETPRWRMLFDDDAAKPKQTEESAEDKSTNPSSLD